jgi:NAD(P) transhydrogenase subunit beta
MALAQAQTKVKAIFDDFERKGKDVRFAIHPVAGRMPGHMNVLLAQEDIPYEKLFELDDINDDFDNSDLVLVIGANDVVNPAANTAEGTPIYGMPVFDAGKAGNVIVFNKDSNPGYSGVPNSLYKMKNVSLQLGDAKETLDILLTD